MNGNIEDLVLSGKLFNPPSRSSSPVRSRSPSPVPAKWPNPNSDEDADFDYDSDEERRKAIEDRIAANQREADSIGMGPGRTGVKGVIKDRDEAKEMAKSKRAHEVQALNAAMAKASLGGKTWAEEERERLAEKEYLEGKTSSNAVPRRPGGYFGHLREVGMRGYVRAIEQEDRNVWVVVHIYDPSLDRCATLDDALSRLARLNIGVKFLRARAGAIGFASSNKSQSTEKKTAQQSLFGFSRSKSRQFVVPGRYPDDDDEDEDEESEEEKEDEWADDQVDTGVLPTLLVYRAGDLVHSWVRVDWEAPLGVEELLRSHNILSSIASGNGNCGLPSDDEDDLDDGELVFSGDEGH